MDQRSSGRLLACLLLASTGWAAEIVVLRNGFTLRAESHEAVGDWIRVVTPGGGWIVVTAKEVRSIKPETPPVADDSAKTRGEPRPAPIRPTDIAGEIERLAAEEGLPGDLVRAVAWAESGFRQEAVSPKGAIGIMQLLPGTAAEVGVDPYEVDDNVRGGTRYLRKMLERFAGDEDQLIKALAAYNAGLSSVAEHNGVPPYPETIEYVTKVIRRFLDLDRSRNGTP